MAGCCCPTEKGRLLPCWWCLRPGNQYWQASGQAGARLWPSAGPAGIATLNIGTPGGMHGIRQRRGRAQPLSYYAYVAANAWLAMAQHSKLNPEQIGVAGHSYGGKWALFAAALWIVLLRLPSAIQALSLMKPSKCNYWEPWYLGWDPETTRPARGFLAIKSRTGAYRHAGAKPGSAYPARPDCPTSFSRAGW